MATEIQNNRMESYSDQQLATLVREGDPDAFLELTSRYMTLIRAKAAPFHGTMLEADDLCQEGLLGLLDAVRNYREDGGASFRTYAGVCITNRIIMAYRWAAGRKNFPLNNFVPLSEEGASCGVFAGEEANPEKCWWKRRICFSSNDSSAVVCLKWNARCLCFIWAVIVTRRSPIPFVLPRRLQITPCNVCAASSRNRFSPIHMPSSRGALFYGKGAVQIRQGQISII